MLKRGQGQVSFTSCEHLLRTFEVLRPFQRWQAKPMVRQLHASRRPRSQDVRMDEQVELHALENGRWLMAS